MISAALPRRIHRDPGPVLGIQALRAFAALVVVLHHMLEVAAAGTGRPFADWFVTSGAAGVDVFFIISGFIIVHSSFLSRAQPMRIGQFLFRRLTRIYPIYWICCVGMLMIVAAGFLQHHPLSIGLLISSFVLLPGDKLLGVAWTLVFEMYFYILFAATLPLRSAIGSVILTTAAIIVSITLGRFLGVGDWRSFLINPLPIEFCLGMATAFVVHRGIAVPLWVGGLAIAVICVAPIVIVHTNTNGLSGYGRVVAWGLPAWVLVLASPSIRLGTDMLGRTILRLGNASYAIYLTHPFLMIGYGRLLKIGSLAHQPQVMAVGVMVLLSLVGGAVVHQLLERPLARVIAKITGGEVGRTRPTISAA